MAEPKTEPLQNKTTTTTTTTPWGTQEELLLVCAINRYGTNSWDSVAKELQQCTPSLSLFTPHLCHLKYLELKSRFESSSAGDDAAVWLDELRRLRVAELKRELHRYDLSIVSLQLKLKKLKEERENEKENSDLKKNDDIQTSVPEIRRRDDDSVNLTNLIEPKPEPAEPEIDEPDRKLPNEPEGEDDSCNGSTNSKEGGPEKERVDSGELVESVAESRRGEEEEEEGVKESSDVQSTASVLGRRRAKKLCGNSSSGEENQSPASKSISYSGGKCKSKSQPLVDFLDVVKGRQLGSVFDRRLDSQETPEYKSLIRQHIDLGIIKQRLEAGQYTDCHAKFYRDLMLLINNAVVYFTDGSAEHKAAIELRLLVTDHFQSQSYRQKSETPKTTPPAPPSKVTQVEADQADLTRLKPTLGINGPIIACRKRSSIVGKSTSKVGERKESALVTELAEKPVGREVVKQEGEKTSSTSFNTVTKKRTRDQSFGSRSSSSKNNNSTNRSTLPNSSLSQKPIPSTPNSVKGENSEAKGDKKKPSPGNISHKMKQDSGSSKDLLLDSLKDSQRRKIGGNGSSGGNAKSERRKDQGQGSQNGLGSKPGKGKGKERTPERRSIGRPPKRAAAMAAMGKRGREGGGETDAHPKKRQRK